MITASRPQHPQSLDFTKADVVNYVENGDVPDPFLDVIADDLMRHPTRVAQTNHVYDRQSLAGWEKACMAKGLPMSCPNTGLPIGRAKLTRVPELELSLQAFRAAVNVELARRGEPLLEEPAAPKIPLWRAVLSSCLGCLGG